MVVPAFNPKQTKPSQQDVFDNLFNNMFTEATGDTTGELRAKVDEITGGQTQNVIGYAPGVLSFLGGFNESSAVGPTRADYASGGNIIQAPPTKRDPRLSMGTAENKAMNAQLWDLLTGVSADEYENIERKDNKLDFKSIGKEREARQAVKAREDAYRANQAEHERKLAESQAAAERTRAATEASRIRQQEHSLLDTSIKENTPDIVKAGESDASDVGGSEDDLKKRRGTGLSSSLGLKL